MAKIKSFTEKIVNNLPWIEGEKKKKTKKVLDNIEAGETVLEMKGITKRFPGVLANDDIDLEIKAGEIHALLGENGAGKTTLMNILYGVHQPDEGEIYVRGKKVDIDSPLDAIELGIGMVHQHLKLIPAHTVLENIILGHPKAGKILDKKKAEREIKELCDKYGFKVDLDAKVWQLSSGEKQIVEIVKALYRGAKLLILDEPTSALTPPETEELLESLKTMAKDEYAIIPFITHKLSMVLDISDRVTVLRDGRAVDRLKTKNATKDSLAEKMVGREVLFEFERPDVEIGKEILKTKNLTALNDRGFPAIRNLSFPIHEGEIFAIVGVAGNGQQELAEVLMGLRDLKKGKITFRGEDITNSPVKERWEKGMGYIPAERVEMGSIGDFSLVDNITMNLYWNDVYSQKGILDKEKLCECTEEACEVFDIKTPDIYTPAKSLSGGNLQKLIVARIFECNPKLLIANLPTHGLDVGAAEFVANKLLEAKKNKAGILLISENLDEALSLADTVAPIYEGEFMGILPREKVTKNKVGLMMAGEKG